ncbi:hypothetical protein AB0M96_36820, partial [Streptomyces sp. NPDC051098]
MELTLLGTGAPAGLPRPDCPCAACATARGSRARAATALLVEIDAVQRGDLASSRAVDLGQARCGDHRDVR